MKKILIIVLLFVVGSVFANEFKLIEFRKLPADFHAERNSVEDMDRDYCTALKIESDVPVDLSLKQKVYKKEKLEATVNYFFVTHKEKQITFTAPKFTPLTVDVPEDGLKKGVVYYVKLEIIPDVTVTLNVTPEPDRIILSDKVMQRNRFKTAPGTYQLQIEKEGFEAINEQITIDEQNSFFSYTLGKDGEVQVMEAAVEKTPVEPGKLSLERFEIVYEITSCEMYEDQIVINMMINNTGDDREVSLLGWGKNRSRMIDDAGNEFFPNKNNFANKSTNGDVKITLVNDIPTKASMIYKKINKKATSISKFDLGVWTEKSGDFRMTFRDIPIEKK
jgi:PEGA domain